MGWGGISLGGLLPQPDDTCMVEFSATTIDGAEFDSSSPKGSEKPVAVKPKEVCRFCAYGDAGVIPQTGLLTDRQTDSMLIAHGDGLGPGGAWVGRGATDDARRRRMGIDAAVAPGLRRRAAWEAPSPRLGAHLPRPSRRGPRAPACPVSFAAAACRPRHVPIVHGDGREQAKKDERGRWKVGRRA